MGTTITKLRAVVDAGSADEAAQKIRNFGQTTSQVSASSSQALGRVSSVLKGDFTGALVGLGAAAGVVTAGVAIGKVALSMDDMRQRASNVRKELTAYAGGATQAKEATEAMLRATDGGISRVDAMANSSRLLGMGLATTSEQVYSLSRMATMLGDKTLGVTDRMASFNAMLANQSIERLDTFGISSGRVRARIEELQAAMPGLSREQAFVNAVLEIGGQKLKDVEAAGVDAASSVDKVNAALQNLKQVAADKIHIQIVVDKVAEAVDNTAYALSDEGAPERQYGQAFDNYAAAAQRVAKAQADLGQWYANITPLAQANYEAKLKEAQAAEQAALAEYRLATMLYQIANGTYEASVATGDYADRLAQARGSVDDANTAAQGLNTTLANSGLYWDTWAGLAERAAIRTAEAVRSVTGTTTGTFTTPSKTRWGLYADWGRNRVDSGAGDLLGQWQERMAAANKVIATDTSTKISDALADAARSFETSLKGALQEGQKFSIGLFDLRPGGDKGPNAPGQNGAFEDIYRLQAFVQNGSWGETAQKYGLDQNTATQRIRDFQSGKWDAGVMALIDKDKLTKQIQDAQLGQAMQDAVAADLAKASGADPKVVRAMLGLGSGSDGATPTVDLGGKLVPALSSAIDAELLAKGADLEARGAVAWERLETGMLNKASKSQKFVQMVNSMVDNALDNYVP